MGSSDIDTVCLQTSSYPDCSDGQSHEGNEGHEGHGRHEGDEGHEEEGGEQDCKGPLRQSYGAPRIQGEDCRWLDRIFFDKEQAWQGCEQEAISAGQEEPLDDCCSEGKEGIENQGLLCSQEGL